jgi:hypothetical protein
LTRIVHIINHAGLSIVSNESFHPPEHGVDMGGHIGPLFAWKFRMCQPDKHGKNYWNGIVSCKTVKANVRPFSYVLTRSFLRPRDVIEFAKCLQNACRRRRIERADRTAFIKAEEEYSDWFRDELVDEVSMTIPEIDDVLDAIRDHGKSSFFARDINSYFQRANITSELLT